MAASKIHVTVNGALVLRTPMTRSKKAPDQGAVSIFHCFASNRFGIEAAITHADPIKAKLTAFSAQLK
jgi:hypothetical protein